MTRIAFLFILLLISQIYVYSQNTSVSKNNSTKKSTKTKVDSRQLDLNSVLNEILKRKQSHQNVLASLRADIEIRRYAFGLNESEILEGSFIFLPSRSKNSVLRVNWAKPKEEVLAIINGKYVKYSPFNNTAFTGNEDEKLDDSVILFKRILSLNNTKLQNYFVIKYVELERLCDGTQTWKLELLPKSKSQYRAIKIWIDVNGMVIQARMTEKNENYSMIRLSNIKKNIVINFSEVKVKLPKGTKIINK